MVSLPNILTDRRISERYRHTDNIEIKVLFTSENPMILGKTIPARCIDVSKDGIRLELCKSLVKNSVLDIVIKLTGSSRRYFLTGNIRWIHPVDRPGYYTMGLMLRDRADVHTDFEKWRKEFAVNFAACANS